MENQEHGEQVPKEDALRSSTKVVRTCQKEPDSPMTENLQGLDSVNPENEGNDNFSVDMVASLVVDFWKIYERAKSESVGERVLTACERAEERLRRIGFEIEDCTGKTYDTNMRVRVLGHEEGSVEVWTISECLSPAIYYKNKLVREADVITKGMEGKRG